MPTWLEAGGGQGPPAVTILPGGVKGGVIAWGPAEVAAGLRWLKIQARPTVAANTLSPVLANIKFGGSPGGGDRYEVDIDVLPGGISVPLPGITGELNIANNGLTSIDVSAFLAPNGVRMPLYRTIDLNADLAAGAATAPVPATPSDFVPPNFARRWRLVCNYPGVCSVVAQGLDGGVVPITKSRYDELDRSAEPFLGKVRTIRITNPSAAQGGILIPAGQLSICYEVAP